MIVACVACVTCGSKTKLAGSNCLIADWFVWILVCPLRVPQFKYLKIISRQRSIEVQIKQLFVESLFSAAVRKSWPNYCRPSIFHDGSSMLHPSQYRYSQITCFPYLSRRLQFILRFVKVLDRIRTILLFSHIPPSAMSHNVPSFHSIVYANPYQMLSSCNLPALVFSY